MKSIFPKPEDPKTPDHGRPDPNKKYLYRYIDRESHWEDGFSRYWIDLYAYEILHYTDKGCWILTDNFYWPRDKISRNCQKFVLNVDDYERRMQRAGHVRIPPPRRWAYANKEHAWESFKIRKIWQESHLRRQLKRVERIKIMIDSGEYDRRFSSRLELKMEDYL